MELLTMITENVPKAEFRYHYFDLIRRFFDLSPASCRVLAWLSEHTDVHGTLAISRTIRERIASELDISHERAVLQYLRELKQAGLINTQERGFYQLREDLRYTTELTQLDFTVRLRGV